MQKIISAKNLVKTFSNNGVTQTIINHLDLEIYKNDFIDKLEKEFEDEIVQTVNYVESMNSATTMYISLKRLRRKKEWIILKKN